MINDIGILADLENAKNAATAAERAAVVAWLRDKAPILAFAIERGEHRREGDKP